MLCVAQPFVQWPTGCGGGRVFHCHEVGEGGGVEGLGGTVVGGASSRISRSAGHPSVLPDRTASQATGCRVARPLGTVCAPSGPTSAAVRCRRQRHSSGLPIILRGLRPRARWCRCWISVVGLELPSQQDRTSQQCPSLRMLCDLTCDPTSSTGLSQARWGWGQPQACWDL